MTPSEALKIALIKEEESIKYYRKMALEHPAIKDLLEMLVNEEEKHKNLIQKKIVELTRI